MVEGGVIRGCADAGQAGGARHRIDRMLNSLQFPKQTAATFDQTTSFYFTSHFSPLPSSFERQLTKRS